MVGAPFANAPDDQGNATGDGGRAYRWAAGDGSGAASGVEQLPVTPMMPGLAGGDHYGYWVIGDGDFDGDGLADLAIGAPTGNIGNNAVAGYLHLLDTSLETVPNLLAAWSAGRRDDGAAVLRFAAGRPASAVAAVDLFRDDRPRPRSPWSGPARSARADCGHPGAGAGVFVFVDADGRDPEPTYELPSASPTARPAPWAPWPVRPCAAGGQGLEWHAPWPNPANPLGERPLPGAGRAAAATGRVYDARGRLVRPLALPPADGAWQRFVWDGTDGRAAQAAASGTYLLRLDAGGESRVRSVTLVR